MLRGESSSSSSDASSRGSYHVYLSFGMEGTHVDFANTLCVSLQRKGISTFRYDKLVERDVMLKKVQKAMEEYLVAIVLLSENYAASTWCLDELRKILDAGKPVIPVFYEVVPSDVRHQINSFAKAFEEHKRRSEEDQLKVQQWRKSLKEVADFSGWESKNRRREELIEDIIKSVWTKIRLRLPSYEEERVGIDSRVEKIRSLLKLELKDVVRFTGIWGMGGIGKTTLARVVFKKICSQFDISCFLENVREISGKSHDMLTLQITLLSHMEVKEFTIQNSDEGKIVIGGILRNNKVLLVLDDVDDARQLDSLGVNDQGKFGPGSRIIVTTRDMEVLKPLGKFEICKIDLLNSDESLQLFCQKAFKRDKPSEQLLQLSKVAVQQAGGLPLALEMMGPSFCGRNESQWKKLLDMKEYSKKDIVMEKLTISYHGLPEIYQILFLDIACFFNGWVKEHVEQILTICCRCPANGIDVLIGKSLVSCDGSRLWMHDLLQEMGRKIVVEKCLIDASKRSRLWSPHDIDQALKRKKKNESIQGIVLKSSTEPYIANWDPEAFSKMYNLKFLIINFHNIQFPRGLKCLSSSLEVLQWTKCTLEALPLGVKLEKLVVLKMRYSKIKKIWSDSQVSSSVNILCIQFNTSTESSKANHFHTSVLIDQHFKRLKFIDLSHSEDLIESPIVSEVPCLEILLLEGCKNLVKVHQSVGLHKKLVVLNLKDCINLQILPTEFKMDSLEELILSGCSKLKKLPKFANNVQCLSLLDLKKSENLICLPKSVCYVSGTRVRLENLKELSFGGGKELTSNSSICMKKLVSKELILPPLSSLTSLKFLNLSYCDLNDESMPDDLGSLSSLLGLDLSGNNFVRPTYCITNLHALKSLTLIDCPRLESLPMLPPNVQCLCTVNSTQTKPLNSAAYTLWKIFELHMNQVYSLYTPHALPHLPPIHPNHFHKVCVYQMEGRPHFMFIILGREIQKWNEECFLVDPSHHPYNMLGCDSAASIKVEAPQYCESSGWLGIAICLALERSQSHVSPHSKGNEETSIYFWACKAHDGEPDLIFPIVPQLSHSVHECNEEKCLLQLIFYVENHSTAWKPSIKKCGCSVIFKEDFEEWCN